MVAIVLGLACIALAVFSFARTRKADETRAKLMDNLSPGNTHPGLIMYAKISRFGGIVIASGMGIFCVVAGALSLVG